MTDKVSKHNDPKNDIETIPIVGDEELSGVAGGAPSLYTGPNRNPYDKYCPYCNTKLDQKPFICSKCNN